MTLSTDHLQFAINDARQRHDAIVKTISTIDTQALSFLQLYVTLAGAALSGAGAILMTKVELATYPQPLGLGLAAFALPLIFGAMLAMATVWPADINLPGRNPDFWLWADEEGITADQAYRAYLQNLVDKNKQNDLLNKNMSARMMWAKICGVAAPIVGAAIGGTAYHVG